MPSIREDIGYRETWRGMAESGATVYHNFDEVAGTTTGTGAGGPVGGINDIVASCLLMVSNACGR
jgi:hypothetical protein